MKPLFLFGTLRYLPLLEAVLGPLDHLALTPARASGVLVCAAVEGPFPVIEKAPEAKADGVLVTGLTAKDHARLDHYEGAFDYALAPVVLEDGRAAEAYFPAADRWTPQGPWSLDNWAEQWGRLSVLAAREVMRYQGLKPPSEVAEMFPMIRARAWSQLNARQSRHGEMTLSGSVEIKAQRRPYARYFALDEYDLRHARFDGRMTPEVTRAVFLAADAALVLPYDPRRDRVLLVEQMRMGPLARGDCALWQLEPIAGRLDPGEAPETAARREALEEAGLEMGALTPVAETYCSPGNSSEFYYVYVGLAALPDGAAGLGGLASEHEDIRSHVISFEKLMEMCDTQKIANAPLVMAAYWLARHRDRLRRESGMIS
ncbi:NUDIX domain-containing protein [Roseobacter weihaiensis]|uniref:NUDIX domain-containing protein n=1 Tax=Roseobacter weihaiensis TaxID=2763262 RepID=UPI001D0B670B|nr:NUDIX domain-containing protein [Roseobacter sp. H9]